MSLSASPRIRAPRRLQLHVFAMMLLGFVGFLIAINGFEPGHLWEVSVQPGGQAAIVNNLSRSSTALISTVFACLFLAIPLTATMYTPQLLDLFVRSWTNRLVLGFFVFTAAYTLSLGRVAADVVVPHWHFKLGEILVLVCFALLLPYLFSVFRFLEPSTIIARVAERALRAMAPGAGSGAGERRRRDELSRRIRHLGSIALKSLDRSDREVALDAIEALEVCAEQYLELKPRHSDGWFDVSIERFPGLSKDAFRLIVEERTWVEMEIQRQLARAYAAALAKVPDVISAISRLQRRFALNAAERHDDGALDLAMRHFNNFLREAVKKKDIHAVYDLLYQYRLLIEKIWPNRPDRVVRAARHLDYYSRMAVTAGMPFARDLVAYDLGALFPNLVPEPVESYEELVANWLAIGRPEPGESMAPGIFKARLVAAARLHAAGRPETAERIEESLGGSGPELIAVAERDLLGGVEPWFWEVTDRQTNLDWLDEDERGHVAAELERLRFRDRG